MTFGDFWSIWPHKRNKHSAQKAFAKLKADEREKATERAEAWCRQWRKDHPDASHIYASTYLNQKRWIDEEEAQQKAQDNRQSAIQLAAEAIKSGKPFLCTHISAAQARWLIEDGLVTEQQCQKVRVL